MKAKKPFADTSSVESERSRTKREAKSRAADRRLASLNRLLHNDDFKDWMFSALFTLCSYGDDLKDTTEFERGIRAAGAFLRRELLVADDAPEFFADLNRRYFAGVRNGILDAAKKKNNDETGER